MYWIGKAKAHESKVDEAKKFIADTIKTCIDDPKRDAVEQSLTQLYVKKKSSTAAWAAASPKASSPAGATPAIAAASPATTPQAAPSPAEPPSDPSAELAGC